MTTPDQRPDPNSVSHEAVARIAQQRAGDLYQQLILRDAKIQEQHAYTSLLEGRINELTGGQPATGGTHAIAPSETQPAPVAD
jgi:hypothetical protein